MAARSRRAWLARPIHRRAHRRVRRHRLHRARQRLRNLMQRRLRLRLRQVRHPELRRLRLLPRDRPLRRLLGLRQRLRPHRCVRAFRRGDLGRCLLRAHVPERRHRSGRGKFRVRLRLVPGLRGRVLRLRRGPAQRNHHRVNKLNRVSSHPALETGRLRLRRVLQVLDRPYRLDRRCRRGIADRCRLVTVARCRGRLREVDGQVGRAPDNRCARRLAEVLAGRGEVIRRARLVREARRIVLLSSGAVRCRRARDLGLVRLGGRGCFRRCRMRRRLQRPSRGNRFIRGSQRHGSDRAGRINASKRVSASYIPRGNGRGLATGGRRQR